MEPHVQYVTTGDGVSIAFSVVGAGPALIEMPPLPFRHLQRSWQFPEERNWMERLARRHRLVEYDPRGMGLSQREVPEYSLDLLLSDLDAVIERTGEQRVALLAFLTSGPLAIAYAARRPERVSHLILWCAAARMLDAMPPQTHLLLDLAAKDWELFTEAAVHAYRGWSAGEPAHRQAQFFRECILPETMHVLIDAGRGVDVTPLLAEVRSPTLVLHRRQLRWMSLDTARQLASGIPGARLMLLDGEWMPPFPADVELAAGLIERFVGEARAERGPPSPASGPLTILFTDVADSTRLTERLGDDQARELLREHERIVRDALRAHDGSEVKALGDGFMAAFASARRAVDCAVAIQAALATYNEAHPGTPIRVRIGVNAGEPVAEEHDLFGTAVNLAARIAAHAEPGQILVSEVVRQLVAGKRFDLAARGDAALPGFTEPVRLYEVAWRAGST